mgnify:FL=1
MSLQERLDTLSAELRATVDQYNALPQKIYELNGRIKEIQDIMKEDDQA